MDPAIPHRNRVQPDCSWWLKTWDRQQEFLLPDREERLSFMFDVVEATDGRCRRHGAAAIVAGLR